MLKGVIGDGLQVVTILCTQNDTNQTKYFNMVFQEFGLMCDIILFYFKCCSLWNLDCLMMRMIYDIESNTTTH
jgi:hypothetical protein